MRALFTPGLAARHGGGLTICYRTGNIALQGSTPAPGTILNLIKMKELARIFMNELNEEEFSFSDYVIYGVAYPTALVAACIITSIIFG